MLDVHVPGHRIGGFKDFMMHLLTITVGLLIALALENAAESLHHRHQRREAEEMIRKELMQNRALVLASQRTIKLEEGNLKAVLLFAQAVSHGEAADPRGLNLDFSEGQFKDAAWRTATATGVLSYMDYDEAQNFVAAYKEQALFEQLEEQTLNDYLQLDSYVAVGFDPRHLNAEDVRAAIPDIRRTLGHLGGMLDISEGTLAQYDVALKE